MSDASNQKKPANKTILEEVNHSNTWFHARKVRPIWAKEFDSDQIVETLEGTESVSAGDFLCRGEAGDTWPQSSKSLNSKYEASDEVDDQGWRKYYPRKDAQGVMAVQISHAFKVHSSWGELSGKPGDLLVKRYEDKDVTYPEDVWIVDQTLFESTYERVEP